MKRQDSILANFYYQKVPKLPKFQGDKGGSQVGVGPNYPFHPINNPTGYRVESNDLKSIIKQAANPPAVKRKPLGLPYKTRDEEVKEAIDRARRENYGLGEFAEEQPSVGKDKKQTLAEKRESSRKKKVYVQNNPNTKQNDQGDIIQTDPDRGFQGQPLTPNAKRFDKGLSHIMDAIETTGAITGLGSVGTNLLRLGAGALETKIGRNLLSKNLKNFTGRVSPTLSAIDDAAAYVQMDPIGIMGNRLNSQFYNPTVALNTANNTLTGVGRNLKNSAIEGTDLMLGENNLRNLTGSKLFKKPKFFESDKFIGTNNVFNQLKGELLQGKSNRQSIKKGNEWLENWIKNPATQEKIDRDINEKLKFDQFLKNKGYDKLINPDGFSNEQIDLLKKAGFEDIDPYSARVKILELIRNQSKNFKPNVKEYSLLKQLDNNLQQYLSGTAKKPIHVGNHGVSYEHGTDPLYRFMYESGMEPPDVERYGSWISRSPKISQGKRESTTIHEGVHDWISKEAFKKSGMRNTALSNMNPDIKKDFLEWENLRSLGKNPDKVMGKQRAYQAYLANPTEQHARIMELRRDLGIKPTHTITPDFSKTIIELIDEGATPVDRQFLNVIDRDPKKLSELFNKFWAVPPAVIGAAALQGQEEIPQQKKGGVINDDRGQWAHPGEVTRINSPYITMQGVPYPVLGISDTGDVQMMYPGEDYEYDGNNVTEFPMMQNGGGLKQYQTRGEVENKLCYDTYGRVIPCVKVDEKKIKKKIEGMKDRHLVIRKDEFKDHLPKFKTLPPILTEDLTKIKAYQDSLNIFNKSLKNLDNQYSTGSSVQPTLKYVKYIPYKNLSDDIMSYQKDYPTTEWYNRGTPKWQRFADLGTSPFKFDKPDDLTESYRKNTQKKEFFRDHKIKPIGFQVWDEDGFADDSQVLYASVYKKPMQPYVFGKPPEPKLKGKVSQVNKLPMGETSQGMGIRERQMPNISAPNVEMSGPYMAGYTDYDTQQGIDRGFRSAEERDAFVEELRKRPAGNYQPGQMTISSYYDVNKRKKKAYGGSMMQKGGIPFLSQEDPEMMYTDRFNTSLSKKEQKDFNEWVAQESQRQGRNILMDKGAYDVQGFWKSGDYKNTDENGHGSDKWKKPNHPTFSNQSNYHGVDGFYGGNWTEKSGYQPSKQSADMYGPGYYNRIFAEEPGRREHLDASRYMSGLNRPSPLYYKNGGGLTKYQTKGQVTIPGVTDFKMPKNTASSTAVVKSTALPLTNIITDSADDSYQSEIADSNNFLTSWYRGRVNDPRYGTVAKRRITEIPKINIKEVSQEHLDKENANAYYMSGTRSIYLNPNNPSSRKASTQTHEKTHELYDQYPQSYQDDIIKSLLVPEKNWVTTRPDLDTKQYGYNYFGDPTEVAARLNVFRRRFGLDPRKKYSESEMKKIMNDFNSMEKHEYNWDMNQQSGHSNIKELFNIIGNDPKKLAELNDKIVMNNIQQQDMARYGGFLPKAQYGCNGKSCTQTGEGVKKKNGISDKDGGGMGTYQPMSNAPVTWEELQKYNQTDPNSKEFKARLKSLKGQFPGLTQQQLLAAGADSARLRNVMFNPLTNKSDVPNWDKQKTPYDRAWFDFYRPIMDQPTKVTVPQILQQQPGGFGNYEQNVRGNYGRPKAQYGGDPSIPDLESSVSMYKRGGGYFPPYKSFTPPRLKKGGWLDGYQDGGQETDYGMVGPEIPAEYNKVGPEIPPQYQSKPREYAGSSIVDYLRSKGYDSSKAFRKDLSETYGIEGYDYSAAKNLQLLEALQENPDLLNEMEPSAPPMTMETVFPKKKVPSPKTVDRETANAIFNLATMSFAPNHAKPKPFLGLTGSMPKTPKRKIVAPPNPAPVRKPRIERVMEVDRPTVEEMDNQFRAPLQPVVTPEIVPNYFPSLPGQMSSKKSSDSKPAYGDSFFDQAVNVLDQAGVPLMGAVRTGKKAFDAASYYGTLGKNYIKRKMDLLQGDDPQKTKSKIKIPTVVKKPTPEKGVVEEIFTPPPVLTGDTIPDPDRGNRFYHLPEMIDLDQVSMGYRNRGQAGSTADAKGNTKAKGLIVTPFATEYATKKDDNLGTSTIRKYNDNEILDNQLYGGVDDKGKFHLDFGKNLRGKNLNMADFRFLDIKGFARDKSGKIILGDETSNDLIAKVPHVLTADGKEKPLNLLIPKKGDKQEETYGTTTGGRLILTTPDFKKKILVSGSLSNINDAIEDFKKTYKTDVVRVVILDNGTYARGLRTKDKVLKKKDFDMYDKSNDKGGAGFYYYKSGGWLDSYK